MNDIYVCINIEQEVIFLNYFLFYIQFFEIQIYLDNYDHIIKVIIFLISQIRQNTKNYNKFIQFLIENTKSSYISTKIIFIYGDFVDLCKLILKKFLK